MNKGKMYISKTSPPSVARAYLDQFQEDFTFFLKSRAIEMVPHGRMVLILHGRQSADASKEYFFAWEVLAKTISDMVEHGLIGEEKLDSFDVPYYTASPEEVRNVVEREGSFLIEYLQPFALDSVADVIGDEMKGERLAKNIRSYTESMISHHFGEEIVDRIYD